MSFKCLAILGFVTFVYAVPVEYQTYSNDGSSGGLQNHENVDYHDGNAEYEFSYAVHDEHTGDIKSQQESRKGDVVQGRYELIDSDGHRRIVEYTADKHNGFNAVVHREPTDIKIPQPQVHQHVEKVAYTQPIGFAAPAAHLSANSLGHYAESGIEQYSGHGQHHA